MKIGDNLMLKMNILGIDLSYFSNVTCWMNMLCLIDMIGRCGNHGGMNSSMISIAIEIEKFSVYRMKRESTLWIRSIQLP
ncbi:hypothetical protein DXB59_14950 [Ruminococcus sp. OM05-10BH]|nr:hypothetical protein DXB59_14950 [Ruminococcus sp. OM05-10BH]